MFGIEGQLEDTQRTDWKLVYVDHENDILLVGDDPWEEFVSCVQSIKILSYSEVQQMSLDGDLGNMPVPNQASSGTDSGNPWKGQYEDNSAASFNIPLRKIGATFEWDLCTKIVHTTCKGLPTLMRGVHLHLVIAVEDQVIAIETVIILARERGLNLELSDIPVQSLVPDPLKVVMQAGNDELEMRGRCSVLTALATSFHALQPLKVPAFRLFF
ncbi:unnamed protein product [Lactuca virosa]|uniref:Auxin-responsive protein n=1 Tax=Lactuca virosa TaxID=75947 RepID=A0AAU9NHS8_9ASTR|nr:unnamed protein product [Lactuca virosa]